MASKIISRSEANAKGLSRYFTGKPCKHGHTAVRKTVNGGCVECLTDIDRRHRDQHREKFRAKWRKSSSEARTRDPEAARAKVNNWAKANRGKENERKRLWREANPEKEAAGNKRWRDANPEKVKLKNKNYKAANAERLAPIAIERTKKWRSENPELAQLNGRKARQHRRARELGAGGSYTQQQIDRLLENQNWLCATPRCGTSLRERKELDHVIALARGGSNDITNLQWLCPRCNRKKQHKSPAEWALACEQLFPTS